MRAMADEHSRGAKGGVDLIQRTGIQAGHGNDGGDGGDGGGSRSVVKMCALGFCSGHCGFSFGSGLKKPASAGIKKPPFDGIRGGLR